MTTAAQRLAQLSGLTGQNAAEHLKRIAGAAGVAAALLVGYSGLPSAAAADHLLADRAPSEQAEQSRTLQVGADARVAVVPLQLRQLGVEVDQRQLLLAEDDRLQAVQAESRLREIGAEARVLGPATDQRWFAVPLASRGLELIADQAERAAVVQAPVQIAAAPADARATQITKD